MAQLVFAFTSYDIEAIAAAVKSVVPNDASDCRMARRLLEYEPCACFDDGVAALRDGSAISVIVRPDAAKVRYGLLNQPRLNGAKLDVWFGTIEYTDTDYAWIWNELLSIESLQIACLGFEEGVELDNMEHQSIAEFPWADRSLVIGAVRSESGQWDIRRGTQYFPSK